MNSRYYNQRESNVYLIIISPLCKLQVIGTNGVFFVDLSASQVDTYEGQWRISDVYTDWLTAGDTITLTTNVNRHVVNFDTSWKENIVGDEMYTNAITSDDIFNGNRGNSNNAPVYVRVARSVFDSRESVYTWGRTPTTPTPRFNVDFYQEPGSRGYGGYSPNTGAWMISYSRQRIAISAMAA